MKRAMLKATAIVTFTGLVLAAGQAMAGCGMGEIGMAGAKPMVYRDEGGGGLLRTAFLEPYYTAPITGLWKFVFTAKGNTGANAPPNALPLPDGALVDAGFVTWHDDGTELMNSGRAPASGSFCMGVWKQVGALTYKLNHWALSWIPAYVPGETSSWSNGPLPAPGPPPAGGTSVGGTDQAFVFAGPTNIQETVTLSRDGTQYTGTFKLIQYNPVPGAQVTAYDPSNIATVITGTVSATRVTVD